MNRNFFKFFTILIMVFFTKIGLAQLSLSLSIVECNKIKASILGGTASTYTLKLNGANAVNVNISTSNTYTYVTNGTGTYTVSVSNSSTTLVTSTIIVSPNLVNISNVNISTPISCFGGNNGCITINASSPNLPLQYRQNSTSSFVSSNVICNLSSGIYQATARDAIGCTKSLAMIMSHPSNLSITATNTSPQCNGGNNATITCASNGGTNPKTYSITPLSGAQSNNVFSALSAGTYSLKVTDANGCTKAVNRTITQPTPIVFSTVLNTASTGCVNCNGSTLTSSTGGVGSKTYSINGSTFNSTSSFTNLCNGNYTLSAKDANNCIVTTTTSLSSSSPSATAPSIIDVAIQRYYDCNNNGIIMINPAVIPNNYTYSYNGPQSGTITNTGGSVSQLVPPGNYTVTATSSGGCSVTFIGNILPATPVSVSVLNTSSPTCSNSNNGIINLTSAGGSYWDYWADLNLGPIPNTTHAFTVNGNTYINGQASLSSGTYTIVASDPFGCSSSTTATIIAPPLPLVLNPLTINNPVCYGDLGQINNISANGGTPPYTHIVDGVVGQSVNYVVPGSYVVHVTDANGCTTTQSVIIQPSTNLIQLSAVSNNAGGIAVTTVVGTSTLSNVSYNVFGNELNSYPVGCNEFMSLFNTNPNPLVYYSLSTASNGILNTFFNDGSYMITYNDVNGCFAFDIVTMNQTNSVPQISNTNPSFNANCEAVFNIVITNLQPFVAYDLSVGNNAYSIPPSSSTTYSVSGTSSVSLSDGILDYWVQDCNSGKFAQGRDFYVDCSGSVLPGPIFFKTSPMSHPTKSVSILPNPFSNQITVNYSLSPNESGVVTLMNLNGSIIEQQKVINSGSYKFTHPDLPNGIYLLKFNSSAGKNEVNKLVKE